MFQKNWQPKPLFALGQDVGQKMMGAGPAPTTAANGKPRGRGGNLTSLISEGGAVGGGIAGAAAGSVVPIVGTAIGGIIGAGLGAFGGRLAENKVRDDEYHLAEAGKEGALSAALTGPLKGLKYLGTAGKSLGSEGLEGALKLGAKEATNYSLRTTLGKASEGKAAQFATKQFGLTDNYLSNFAKKHKEDAGKTIMRYSFSSPDDVAEEIVKQQNIFDSLIGSAGKIKKTTLQQNFDKSADDLLSQMPDDQKKAGQALLTEVRQLMDNFGDEIDPTELNAIRKQYDSVVNYPASIANPAKNTANKRVADIIRDTVRDSAGGELKKTGSEISKLIDLSKEMAKRAPAVQSRASSPLGFRNLAAAAIGGGVAGVPGAIATGVGASAINSKTGRKVLAKGAQMAAEGVTGSGRIASPLNMAAKAGAVQPLEGMLNQPKETNAMGLEDALLNQSMPSQSPTMLTSNPMTSANAMSPMSSNMQESYPNSQQMSSGSGITREKILQAMMMDLEETGGQNFGKIQMLYEFANPDTGMGGLSESTAGRVSSVANAQNTIGQLEGLFNTAGGGSGRLGGLLKNQASRIGFDDNTQSYNDLSQSSVTQIAKALNGGGQVSDADAAVIVQALPRITDSPEVARIKFEALRQRLLNSQSNALTFSGASGGLEDVLTQGAMY